MATAKRQLIEHLYPGNLTVDVKYWVLVGVPWREIAARVSQGSGETVSHETLRNWFKAEQDVA
jgi:hypothetical protein